MIHGAPFANVGTITFSKKDFGTYPHSSMIMKSPPVPLTVYNIETKKIKILAINSLIHLSIYPPTPLKID
jgi:hypothetical protein